MASNRENKQDQMSAVENDIDTAFSNFSKKTIKEITKNISDPNLKSRIFKLFTALKFEELIQIVLENNVISAVKLGYGGEIQFEAGVGKKILTRSWVDDGINASKRIQRATNKVKRAVADDITDIIKEGNSNRKITKSIKKKIDAGDLDSDAIRSDITRRYAAGIREN